jgi:hypothetical protein
MDNSAKGKHVILQLEYDLGDYSDVQREPGSISTNPEDYKEIFQQSDVLVCDMQIVGARIEEK